MAVKPARPSPGKKREDERTTGVKSRVTPGRVQPSPARPQVGVAPYIPPNLTPRPAAPPDNFTPMTQEPDLLPRPQPIPIQQTFTPFVHATRTDEGPVLWRGPQGNAVQPGDILPNLQQALKPVFRPREAQEARGGTPSDEEFARVTALARAGSNPALLPALLGKPARTAGEFASALGTAYRGLMDIPTSWPGAAGAVGGAIAGTPEAVINIFDKAGRLSEHAQGFAAMSLGGYSDPIEMIRRVATGGAAVDTNVVAPMVRRLAVGVLAEAGFEQEARRLAAQDPGELMRTVARAVAVKEENGEDAAQLRTVLELIVPGWTDRLVEEQRQFLQLREAPAMSRWQAGEYTYEGAGPTLAMAQQLARGASFEDAAEQVEGGLTTMQRVRDLVGQVVLDPLNVLDVVPIAKLPVVGQIGGGPTQRLVNWADEARAARVIRAADPDEVIARFKASQDVADPRLLERISLFRRTDESRLARVAAETSDVLFGLRGHIADDAPEMLRAINVEMHPDRALMHVFMNPAADDVAGTGRSADEIKRALGLAGDQLGPSYNASGDVVDMFMSPAAIRAREVMKAFGGKEADGLFRQWGQVEKAWQEALGARGISHAARDELMSKAQTQFARYLDNIERAARVALDMDETVTVLSRVTKPLNQLQGIFATYFHMGLSPGWAVRNWTNNNVTLMIDGVEVFSSLRKIEDNIADYEVLGSALSRVGGVGRIDDRGAGGRLAQRLLPGYVLGGRAERAGHLRGIWHGFKQTMQRYHRLGQSIPVERYEALSQALGDQALAREVLLNVENAWTGRQLDRIIRKFEREPWRLLQDEDLVRRINRYDRMMLDDIEKMLDEADDVNALPQRFEEYLEAARKRADDSVGMHPPQQGTVDELNIADTQHALNDIFGVPEGDQRLYIENTNRRISAQNDARDTAHNFAHQHLNELEELRQAGKLTDEQAGQFAALQGQYLRARKQEEDASAFARPLLDRLRKSLYHQDGLHWQDQPEFAHAVEVAGGGREGRGLAWDTYFPIRDETWTRIRAEMFDTYRAIGEQAAGVLGRELSTPPVWDDIMVRHNIGVDDWENFRQVQTIAHEHGINNVYHLTNHLKKEGLLPADVPLFQPEHINAENYPRIVDSLRGRGAREAAERAPDAAALEARVAAIRERMTELNAQLSAAEVGPGTVEAGVIDADAARAEMGTLGEELQNLLDELDGIDDTARAIGEMGNKPRTTAAPPNVHDWRSTHRAAVAEIERLLQDTLAHVTSRAAMPARKLTDEQVRAIRAFIKDIRPRLAEARTVAQKVGDEVSAFALHNYSDRRNFDTLLGIAYAYPYWYTRTLANFVRRGFQQPGAVSALIKLRQGLRRINRDLPEWWQDQLTLETPLGIFHLPILNMLDPLNGFLGDKFYDPDQRSHPLGKLVSEMGNYGPGVHSWVQLAMFGQAWARGARDEQLSWLSYLGQPTQGFHAATVLARQAGLDFIPPGGLGIEPWMYQMTSEGLRFTGSKWEASSIARSLYELYENGEIEGPNPLEQMGDAAYAQEGELYDRALQRGSVRNGMQSLLSWLGGAALKVRPQSDVEIAQFDMLRAELWRRRPGGGAADEMSREQQRLAYQELSRQYPWGDAVIMFRRDDDERDERMIWSVFNRLPPNNRAYLQAAGIDPRQLDAFYEQGWSAFTGENRDEFVGKMRQLYAVLALPETATQDEWFEAINARDAMNLRLSRQFGDGQGNLDDIYEWQDAYYQLRDAQGYDAATAYLDEHPMLSEYWSVRQELIMSDPLLAKYYASMDMFERAERDAFNSRMAAQYPDLDVEAFWTEYWSLREAGLFDDAAALFDEHPEMDAYIRDKNLWTLELRDRLLAVAAPIEALQPTWAALREDPAATGLLAGPDATPGQRDIAELIAAGGRPMGDFELPEDLEANEVRAALDLEKATLQGSEMWGIMYNALEEMGGLDDTLRAYNEWKDVATVQAHLPELKALLVAMERVRLENGWDYAGDVTGKALLSGRESTDARSRTGGGSGGYSGSGGGYGSRRADDDGLLVGMPEGMTMEQYATWYPSARWATNEVRDIGKYLAATIESGSPLNPSLMSLSADTRTMVQAFLAATQGQQLDPGAVQDYLAAAVGANDPAAGLDALPPALHGPASQLGAAFLAELAERMGGGSSGGGSRGGRVRSSSYGGASEQPQTEKQENALHMQIHAFMTDLRRRAPTFWNHLRNMANMSESELAAFLSDPANAHFKRWLLEQVYPRYGTQMAALMTYFKERSTPPAVSSGYNRPYTRAGASQRWGVNYGAA